MNEENKNIKKEGEIPPVNNIFRNDGRDDVSSGESDNDQGSKPDQDMDDENQEVNKNKGNSDNKSSYRKEDKSDQQCTEKTSK